jgi:hypothetical protein
MNMHVKRVQRWLQQHATSSAGIPFLIYLGFIFILFLLLDLNPISQDPQKKLTAKLPAALGEAEFNQMLEWPLFGQGAALQTMNNTDLELIGIIMEGDESVAIIRVNGEDQFLKSGSKINGKYSINKIEKMRVIVASENGLEQLELFQNMKTDEQSKKHADGES